MNFFMEYSNNLADALFWPAIVIAIICTITSVVAYNERAKMTYGSGEYKDATWRILAAVQGGIIIMFLWAGLNAVPEPNYIVREKTVVTTRNTYKPFVMKYEKAFSTCWNAVRDQKQCHEVAMFTVEPNRVIPKPVIKFRNSYVPFALKYQPIYDACYEKQSTSRDQCHNVAMLTADPSRVVVRKIKEPYIALYNACMGISKDAPRGWDLNEISERDARIKVCHAQAMEARK